jgi:hypothetical protein
MSVVQAAGLFDQWRDDNTLSHERHTERNHMTRVNERAQQSREPGAFGAGGARR